MKVYAASVVRELADFYGGLITAWEQFSSVKDHLSEILDRNWEGIRQQDHRVWVVFNNWHPNFIGQSHKQADWTSIRFEDCKVATAKHYGFDSWTEVEKLESVYSPDFEEAVENLIHGNIQVLTEQIDRTPDLLQYRSPHGYAATLLHYTGNNGVEIYRQKVPANLPEIVRLLIDKGADVHAEMKIYNGHFTTKELAATSAHPNDAGIMNELLAAF